MRGERGEGVKKAGTALREVGQCEWVLCALFHFSGAFHGVLLVYSVQEEGKLRGLNKK